MFFSFVAATFATAVCTAVSSEPTCPRPGRPLTARTRAVDFLSLASCAWSRASCCLACVTALSACARFCAFWARVSPSPTVALCTLCAAAASETAICAFSWSLSGLIVCCSRPFALARPPPLPGRTGAPRANPRARAPGPRHMLALLDQQRRQRPAVWKLTETSPAEATLPLADTEVVTTPRCTVAVRVAALAALDEASLV